jgi:hypothetical protein
MDADNSKKRTWSCFDLRLSAFICGWFLFASAAIAQPMLGDMDNEVRDSAGRFDVQANADALTQLGANTYFYLVWHDKNDWTELPAFAVEVEKRGINVWVYLIPWSETPLKKKQGWGYSEPFRTDYVQWAEEIGRLSLTHKNIVGYVIDDFYDNTEQADRFTPGYVKRMVNAGKAINPRLKFFPLMYFQTPWQKFIERYGEIVDGVVICYPKSETGIRNALRYLKGQPHGASVMFQLDRRKGTAAADHCDVEIPLKFEDPTIAEVSFYFDATDKDDDTSDCVARVRLDGRVIWQRPTMKLPREEMVTLDISGKAKRGRRHTLEFSIYARSTGNRYTLPVVARFDDIRVYGTSNDFRSFEKNLKMIENREGKFEIITSKASSGTNTHLPVILMPSGEGEQYEKRYDESGTPEAVAKKVRECFDLLEENAIEGIVPYRIPKPAGDAYFDAIRREYAKYLKAHPLK